MTRGPVTNRLLVLSILVLSACAFGLAQPGTSIAADAPACDMSAAAPFINRWFAAWDLVSGELMHLHDAPSPDVVFYDSLCVYTTSSVAAPGAQPVDGPSLRGQKLSWRAAAHGDSITFPNGTRVGIALMSFANNDKKTGPFFVMAAPSYWAQQGFPNEPTAVFLHEFAHTRQIPGMMAIIGPIDSTWKLTDDLNDDVVQEIFGPDSTYVAAYQAERDLIYKAAGAESIEEARRLATQALEMMRSRHARWFTGDKAVFAVLDDTWLSMEGAGQWAGYAWLAHPKGGGLDRDAAVARMLGRRRWWSQDEGLGVFLVLDRLLPEWPALVFDKTSIGALDLLERAVKRGQ